MMPVLFKLPGLGWDITGYGMALMIGFLVSIVWAANRALKSGANPDAILNCGFLALIGGVVGSRAMYVAHYWEQFAHRGSNAQVLLAIIDVRKGGLEVYGGVIAVAVLVLLYLWLWRHSIRWYLDITAPSAALGMAIGRIGCFVNGCCWGGVCDLPWAVRFPFGSPPTVQQWGDRLPGAGLPEELLVFASDGGVLGDGSAAIPIPRESFRASDRQLDEARKAYDELLARSKVLQSQLKEETDPQVKKRLNEEVRALGRQMPAMSQFVEMVAPTMSKYDLSAAELRGIARRHRSLPVHPAQLYSVITLGLLALLLSAVYWRRTRDGQVICVLLLVEPLTRWVLEFTRADNPVDTLGAFTISQGLALGLSALGLIGLLTLRWMPPRSPRAVIWEPPEEETSGKPKKSKGAASA